MSFLGLFPEACTLQEISEPTYSNEHCPEIGEPQPPDGSVVRVCAWGVTEERAKQALQNKIDKYNTANDPDECHLTSHLGKGSYVVPGWLGEAKDFLGCVASAISTAAIAHVPSLFQKK